MSSFAYGHLYKLICSLHANQKFIELFVIKKISKCTLKIPHSFKNDKLHQPEKNIID